MTIETLFESQKARLTAQAKQELAKIIVTIEQQQQIITAFFNTLTDYLKNQTEATENLLKIKATQVGLLNRSLLKHTVTANTLLCLQTENATTLNLSALAEDLTSLPQGNATVDGLWNLLQPHLDQHPLLKRELPILNKLLSKLVEKLLPLSKSNDIEYRSELQNLSALLAMIIQHQEEQLKVDESATSSHNSNNSSSSLSSQSMFATSSNNFEGLARPISLQGIEMANITPR